MIAALPFILTMVILGPIIFWVMGKVEPIGGCPKPPEGVCPKCGYDLRATPDKCPECGRGH